MSLCGTSIQCADLCSMWSNNWVEKNFGTEKVEELLEELFPNQQLQEWMLIQ